MAASTMQINTKLKPWLQTKIKQEGKLHRTLEDIDRKLEPKEVWNMTHAKHWPYKANKEALIHRDRALLDLLYVVAPRISEALRLRKEQFDVKADFEFVLIRNLALSKRKKLSKTKHGLKGPKFREEIPLAREGPLAQFTEEIEAWIIQLPSNAYVFPTASRYDGSLNYEQPMSRQRAWAIVHYVTEQWCHFFRSQGESYYAKVFKSAWALKDFMGLTDTKTLDRYVKTDWRDYHKQLLGQ